MLERIIDLKSIGENVLRIKSLTNKEIIAVIKSDAYGYGANIVASIIMQLGVNIFAVNSMQEAIELCKNNINKDILILNSFKKKNYQYLDKYSNIVVSINCFDDAMDLSSYSFTRYIKVHIQYDTGMNRLGICSLEELIKIVNILNNNEKVIIEGLYSHFVSDDANQIAIQEQNFQEIINLYDFKMIHIANSGAITKSNLGNYVRVGLALYGDVKLGLKQVMSIKTKPLWVRDFTAGMSLGYELKYKCLKDCKIALLPFGYANGYLQSFQGFKVFANNKYYEVVGKVCMNHTFVLVDESVTIDTNLWITNDNLRIEELANFINCTPHQISCLLKADKTKYIFGS